MIVVAALAYWLTGQPDGFARALPLLGTMAIGAQRILPVLQQMFREWSFLQGGAASLKDVLTLLDQPLPAGIGTGDDRPLSFRSGILLKDLSFRYAPESPEVLRDITLRIPKGSRMGFIGATGSGKSTLLDILMGLLFPTEGVLEVDGVVVNEQNQRAWQRRIAHVPQAVFLADSSIEENIAFGVPKAKIDHERVRHAAEQAQLGELIESWPHQYDTFVGERGVRLSGGQRQRIGIARALYKQAEVIIFDEATSALDSETESAVMKAIEELSKDLTILIIAHRLTTLKDCDTVVELKSGVIIAQGPYDAMVANRN
jgi:ATP-binding cassette subfamily B protein